MLVLGEGVKLESTDGEVIVSTLGVNYGCTLELNEVTYLGYSGGSFYDSSEGI